MSLKTKRNPPVRRPQKGRLDKYTDALSQLGWHKVTTRGHFTVHHKKPGIRVSIVETYLKREEDGTTSTLVLHPWGTRGALIRREGEWFPLAFIDIHRTLDVVRTTSGGK